MSIKAELKKLKKYEQGLFAIPKPRMRAVPPNQVHRDKRKVEKYNWNKEE